MAITCTEPEKLNVKMQYAVADYIDHVFVRSEPAYTYNQALAKAGYGERYIHSHGAEMWQCVAVQKLIQAWKVKQDLRALAKSSTVRNWCIEQHITEIESARKREDGATATQNIIAIGKTEGIYTDNLNTDNVKIERLTAAERAIALRISNTVINSKPLLTGNNEENKQAPSLSQSLAPEAKEEKR